MQFTRRTMLAGLLMAPAARLAAAPRLSVPQVDRLELTVLADGSASVFGVPVERPGLRITPAPRLADYRRAFQAEWGYGLLARAEAGGVTRSTLIDFGYTPAVLANNMELLGLDAADIDAMVLTHGHYDHWGGIAALVEGKRLKRGTPLFVGGEEAFCDRVRGVTPASPGFGAFDRAAAERHGVVLRVGGTPAIAGHGFTTGTIPLASPERPKVPTAMRPGHGCAREALPPEKRDADFLVDDAVHELGAAFHLRDKGLVVVGACSHRGIINTVLQARAVSGVDRVHAIMGGFHLVPPQTAAQALETVTLMQALSPDYVFPGHCTGETFIAAAIAAMPDKVFRAPVGTRILLGAQ